VTQELIYLFSPVLRLSWTFITNIYKRLKKFLTKKCVYKRFYLLFNVYYIYAQAYIDESDVKLAPVPTPNKASAPSAFQRELGLQIGTL